MQVTLRGGMIPKMIRSKQVRVFLYAGLLVYLVLVCWILFVNVGTTDRSTYFHNPDDHFIPFQSTYGLLKLAKQYGFKGYYLRMMIRNIAGNFFLFFPLGIILPLLFQQFHKTLKVAGFTFIISLVAEMIQYFFSIGVFDVDDILLNTIGSVAGYFFLQFLFRFYNRNGGKVFG